DQEKADYRAVEAWTNECLEDGKAEVVRRLRELGYPDAQPETMFVGPLVCRQAAMLPALTDKSSFAAFDRERTLAAPIIDTFLVAVRLAESQSGFFKAGLADELQVQPVGGQMLRLSLAWGNGATADAPALSPVGSEIAFAR